MSFLQLLDELAEKFYGVRCREIPWSKVQRNPLQEIFRDFKDLLKVIISLTIFVWIKFNSYLDSLVLFWFLNFHTSCFATKLWRKKKKTHETPVHNQFIYLHMTTYLNLNVSIVESRYASRKPKNHKLENFNIFIKSRAGFHQIMRFRQWSIVSPSYIVSNQILMAF